MKEALNLVGDKVAYVSGGTRLYEEALALVDKMYVTEIDAIMEGDAFFPAFDENLFVKEIEERVEGDVPYTYVTYIRKR